MTKKSKWIAVVAIVLVFACMATLLVGCKPKEPNKPDNPDKPTPPAGPTFEAAMTQITTGLFKSTDAAESTLFGKLGTELNMEVTTTDGDNSETYKVTFGLGLDLLNSFKTGTGKNRINLVVKDSADKTVFRVTYDNAWAPTKMILQAGDKAYYVNVPDVAKTIQEQFTKAGLAIEEVEGSLALVKKGGAADGKDKTLASNDDVRAIFEDKVPGVLNLVGGVLGKNIKVSADKVSFDLEISEETLKDFGDILKGFNKYVDALGLDFDLSQLASKLPKITLSPSFTFADGALTNIDVAAGIGAARFVIPHKEGGTNLLDLDIPRDLKLSVKAGFAVIDPANVVCDYTVPTGIKTINAINLKLKATLTVNEAINMGKIADIITLDIPKDTYDVELNASIDPTKLIGVDFTDANGKFSLDNLLNALFGKLEGGKVKGNAIDFLSVSVVGRDPANPQKKLIDIRLNPTKNKAAIEALGLKLPGNDVAALITFVKGLLPKDETPSTDATTTNAALADAPAADEDKVMDIIKQLAPTIKNLIIQINETKGLDVELKETKYATWINDSTNANGGYFDINKQWLSVAAKATLNKTGLNIHAEVKNGGTIFGGDDPNKVGNININVDITIAPDGISFGDAVAPIIE